MIGHKRTEDLLELATNSAFCAKFLGIFKTTSKTITYVIHYLALHYWLKFQKNLTTFGVVMAKKTPRSSKNCTFCCYEIIWDIKWNLYIYIYDISPDMCYPNTFRLPKNGAVNQEGGRREGILKLLVKVWLKFERSFGDLLHINPQKVWPRWLLACLLLITSPLTSSYSFFLSFFGHWHSFAHNHSL